MKRIAYFEKFVYLRIALLPWMSDFREDLSAYETNFCF